MGILLVEERRRVKDAKKLMSKAHILMHIGSVACAVEALEQLLVEKNVLQDGELMDRLKKVTEEKAAQAGYIPGGDD